MAKKDKKKKKSTSLTASQQRDMEISIRTKMGEGKNAAEIMNVLGLQPHIFQSYIARIQDIDRDFFNTMTSVDVYSTMTEKARVLIKELHKMRKRFDYRKQFTAVVASIKQEHDINKDMVKLGQQLGFIEQKGAEITVESEMIFSTMTTEQVKIEIQNEVERLNKMATVPTVAMRPELLEAIGDNEEIRKFIPDYIEMDKVKPKKQKVKIKTKVKLRRRM